MNQPTKVTIYRNDKPIELDYHPLEDPYTFFGRNVGELIAHFGQDDEVARAQDDGLPEYEDKLYEELYEQGVLHEIMVDCYKVYIEDNYF